MSLFAMWMISTVLASPVEHKLSWDISVNGQPIGNRNLTVKFVPSGGEMLRIMESWTEIEGLVGPVELRTSALHVSSAEADFSPGRTQRSCAHGCGRTRYPTIHAFRHQQSGIRSVPVSSVLATGSYLSREMRQNAPADSWRADRENDKEGCRKTPAIPVH